MPIYEFICGACGNRFEELAAAGTERAACRECGSSGAERVLSQFAQPTRLVMTPRQARRVEDRRRARKEERSRPRSGDRGG